jgi:predicted acyl esterase
VALEREQMAAGVDDGHGHGAYAVRIALPPTGSHIAVGHRIRIDVASSSFPQFDVNPGTGEALGRHSHLVTATNFVYFDRARPSHVVLPVVPAAHR